MKRPLDKLGRVSLPVEYRRELGLVCGDYVEVELIDGYIVVTNPVYDDKKQKLIQAVQTGADVDTLVDMINNL